MSVPERRRIVAGLTTSTPLSRADAAGARRSTLTAPTAPAQALTRLATRPVCQRLDATGSPNGSVEKRCEPLSVAHGQLVRLPELAEEIDHRPACIVPRLGLGGAAEQDLESALVVAGAEGPRDLFVTDGLGDGRPRELVEELVHGRPGARAGELGDDLAVTESLDGRDARDAEPARKLL